MRLLAITLLSAIVAFGYWRSETASLPVKRFFVVGGVLSIAALVMLGSIWPSIYTIAALLALPAAGILIVRLFKPGLLSKPWSLVYTRLALVLPPLTFAYMFWWTSGCQWLGRCQ